MTIPHAVILTSIAWAIIATALVAIEKWSARRHYLAGFATWHDDTELLTRDRDAHRNESNHWQARHLAAERGLREYARAVEMFASNAPQSFRGAARAVQEAPTVPGSWKA